MIFEEGKIYVNPKDVYGFGWLCYKKGEHEIRLVSKIDLETGLFEDVYDPHDMGVYKIKYKEFNHIAKEDLKFN